MAKMSRDEIKKLQEIIGTDVDGIWGPKSRAAYSAWLDNSSQPSEDTFVQPTNLFEGHQSTSGYTPEEFEQNLVRADGIGSDPSAKSGFDPADSFVAPQMDNLYDKSTRIAEIQRRLDEIKREKEKYDMEGKMGEYKFLYDADPSTYMSYKQNLRSNEQTNAIRKASEDATKASQAQTAWRQLLIDEETAKYEKMDAENKVRAAQQSGDAAAYRDAKVGLSRINAKMNRLAKDKDEYRNRFAEMLGLSKADLGEPAEGDWDEGNDDTYKKLKRFGDLQNKYTNAYEAVRIQDDNTMSSDEKGTIRKDADKALKEMDIEYKDLSDILGSDKRDEWIKKRTAFVDAKNKFGRKQSSYYSPEQFKNLGYADLKKLGYNRLMFYKNKGYTNTNLEAAINVTASRKGK